MKTETNIYVREATSSAGWGLVSGTAAPDSMASQIKNCTIVRQPTILVRGNRVHFTKDDGSAANRPPSTSKLPPVVTKPQVS